MKAIRIVIMAVALVLFGSSIELYAQPCTLVNMNAIHLQWVSYHYASRAIMAIHMVGDLPPPENSVLALVLKRHPSQSTSFKEFRRNS